MNEGKLTANPEEGPKSDHGADTDNDIVKQGCESAYREGEFESDGDVDKDRDETDSQRNDGIDKEVFSETRFNGIPGRVVEPRLLGGSVSCGRGIGTRVLLELC